MVLLVLFLVSMGGGIVILIVRVMGNRYTITCSRLAEVDIIGVIMSLVELRGWIDYHSPNAYKTEQHSDRSTIVHYTNYI